MAATVFLRTIIRIDGTNDKPVLNHISNQTVNEGDPQIYRANHLYGH
ncbi:hypothetical protein O9993_23305 [Vibrio lentus]|nr:hypothetical protein [Vibrio lentus]